jgi:hypothetical protein
VIEINVDLFGDGFEVGSTTGDSDSVAIERSGEFTPEEIGHLWEGLALVVIVNDYRGTDDYVSPAPATYRFGDLIMRDVSDD